MSRITILLIALLFAFTTVFAPANAENKEKGKKAKITKSSDKKHSCCDKVSKEDCKKMTAEECAKMCKKDGKEMSSKECAKMCSEHGKKMTAKEGAKMSDDEKAACRKECKSHGKSPKACIGECKTKSKTTKENKNSEAK